MVRFLSSNFGFLLIFLGAVWWGTDALSTWIGVVVVVVGVIAFLGGLARDIWGAIRGDAA